MVWATTHYLFLKAFVDGILSKAWNYSNNGQVHGLHFQFLFHCIFFSFTVLQKQTASENTCIKKCATKSLPLKSSSTLKKFRPIKPCFSPKHEFTLDCKYVKHFTDQGFNDAVAYLKWLTYLCYHLPHSSLFTACGCASTHIAN